MQYAIVLNKMFNTIPYPTREFPKVVENPLFRIDWFGQFSLNPLALSEPTVEVILKPYLGAEIDRNTVNSKLAYNHEASQTIRVGVGQLPGLCIGSFIQDRQVVAVPDYRVETYNLTIDDAHTAIIRADATYRDGGRNVPYIPHAYYPLSTHVRSTRCMVVERAVEDEKDVSHVIFPCVELLRAYFATSSALIKEVVKGGMSVGVNRIFNPERTGFDVDGTAYLGLRPEIGDENAWAVARFALDANIRSEVQYIHDSIVLNGNNGEGYVPVVRPPFRGTTKMILHGKRLKSGRRWHFLVFRIEDCTGPYPYERLRFKRDNDGGSDGTKDLNRPEAYKDDTESVQHSSLKSDEPEIRSDDEPSLDRIETNIKLSGGRFSTTPEDIEKVEKIECHFRAAERRKFITDEETKGFSTADGDHGETELDRLRISQDRQTAREDLSDRLCVFLNVLEEMRRQSNSGLNYRLVTVPPPALGVEDSGVSFFPDKLRGRTLSWSFLPGPPKTRRRVIVAEVCYHDQHFYLFEAEKRPPVGKNEESITSLIVHSLNGTSISDRMLAQILLQGAKEKGVWLNDWQWTELRREKLVHQSVTVKRFAQRFIEYFQEVVSVAVEVPSTTPPATPNTSIPNAA